MAKLYATEAAQRVIDQGLQLHGGQGSPAAGFAIQHDVQVTCGEFRAGTDLEFEQTTRHVYCAWQVTQGVFVGFANINHHIGVANCFVNLFQGNFAGFAFGLGDEIVCSFHDDLCIPRDVLKKCDRAPRITF